MCKSHVDAFLNDYCVNTTYDQRICTTCTPTTQHCITPTPCTTSHLMCSNTTVVISKIITKRVSITYASSIAPPQSTCANQQLEMVSIREVNTSTDKYSKGQYLNR